MNFQDAMNSGMNMDNIDCELFIREGIIAEKEERCIPLSVIDAIKAEIKDEAEFAYADFERYKVERLGQDWEDAYDSLPQDDFRYGMQRALEIICKHTSRKEKE